MILSPKHVPRLAATVGLFTRYGLLDFAKQQGLLSLNGSAPGAEDDSRQEESAEKAHAFRERLVELGPAYIKLGQVLSTRPDLLPATYIEELEHLQDDVPEMPFEQVEETIQEELHARISKLFGSFDEKPLGSASLGQVHAATLRDGRSVVVKVQRPGIRDQLKGDIEYFRELANFLTAHLSAANRFDLPGIVMQVERALVDELDYRTEAKNAAAFRRDLVQFKHLLLPRVIDAYTTHKVLTMERIRGIKIDEIPPVTRIDYDFGTLAEEFAKAYLYQITVAGHFHADPHPGNVFVVLPDRVNPLTPPETVAMDRRDTPREAVTAITKLEKEARDEGVSPPLPEDPKLALIDFGMTAHITEKMRNRFLKLLLSMADRNGDNAAEALIEMGEPAEDFNRQAYIREASSLIASTTDQSVGDTQTGTILYELISIGFRHGLKLPAELTLLAKALFNLDAITRALDPSFNPTEAVREYTSQIANKRARREFSPGKIFQMATESTDLLRALPHRLDILTQKLAANDFAVRVDAPELGNLLKGFEKIANRIFTGLVLGGLLVASGMLISVQRSLGILGFLAAGVIGLYMVITILVTDSKTRKKGG